MSNSQRKRQLIKELKSNLPNLRASAINLLAELAVSAVKQDTLAGQAKQLADMTKTGDRNTSYSYTILTTPTII